ncbi:protein phosphatase 2C domain-containing protein [Hymenobacter monticola]|uniref:Protein phosphatase 2C domain-containing protein n=1 Tax=Hymenobacter monticola TaxID=1705399 RepID=A0ABY4BBY4_9BACT|nr:PP2C family serine/threonine-protein phosphatase [Hymenobacter monticola]UOE36665.1 protein phosphatase 2C domain-containing protein [Hymenobacter monticola]
MSPEHPISAQPSSEPTPSIEGTPPAETTAGQASSIENQAAISPDSEQFPLPDVVSSPAQPEPLEAGAAPQLSQPAELVYPAPLTEGTPIVQQPAPASEAPTAAPEEVAPAVAPTAIADEVIAVVEPVPPVAPQAVAALIEPALPIAPAVAPVVEASNGVFVSGKAIVLPNGKVGESYSFKFTPDVVDLGSCLNIRVLGPEGLGLTFDQATQALAGMPSLAGQHELRLSYQPATAKAGDPAHIRALQWYVNPDPRSLWTEHEPAADLLARKDHVAHQIVAEGPKTIVAASRRGRSHAKDAKFREDDFRCYFQTESKSYVLAVADGAGSATMSREGSRLACETATDHVLSALSGETSAKLRQLTDAYDAAEGSPESRKALQDELYKLLGNAALLAARQITQTAEAAGHVARDYATTLLLALCHPTANGWLVGAFWIGDGGLGLYRRQEGIRLLGEPDGGEYSGQTRFLTMKETFEASSLYGRVRFELVPDFDALVLMSDGITDALFQTDSNLAKSEKWGELLDGINSAAPLQRDNQELGAQLSEWLNFWVKGEYDDRTIAILF